MWLARRDRSYLQYFSTLRVLKPLGILARTIMHPHLLQRRSARKPASRLSYRGFARMIADQD
jgi:hypothetical protein